MRGTTDEPERSSHPDLTMVMRTDGAVHDLHVRLVFVVKYRRRAFFVATLVRAEQILRAPSGAEVTIDLPNPDHILEFATTDDAGFLFDSSEHEVPISRAITALIPDFDEYERATNTDAARRRAELWKALRADSAA